MQLFAFTFLLGNILNPYTQYIDIDFNISIYIEINSEPYFFV